ncbi:MAG: hypothetical protein IPM29_26300 [Planctomycetes bacterium]|nr:hypothetical protein [Planctomycetota bacterium]
MRVVRIPPARCRPVRARRFLALDLLAATLSLPADQVSAVGASAARQCEIPAAATVVEIDLGSYRCIARLADGSVCASGDNSVGGCSAPTCTS